MGDVAEQSQLLRFRILGPVEIVVDGTVVRLPATRQRTVLALMLLEANQVVSIDSMVTALWDENPPSTARSQVQICVSAVRRTLAEAGTTDIIRTHAPGYVLRIEDGQLDAQTFEHAAARASRSAREGQLAEAAATLRDALALWSGPALTDVPSRLVHNKATRLDERRLSVYEECVDWELELGRHAELTSELLEQVAAHPLRERIRGQLMLALYRSGRQAEALDVYQNLRSDLIEQLGIEPGEDLRTLESAILANDPALQQLAETTQSAPGLRQLTADTGDFTGRESEVAELTDVLTANEADGGTGGRVPIAVVAGKGGVGKSALAIHVAHLLGAEHFPDGQLYVDLRGTQSSPVTPAEVLGRWLRAFGVQGSAIPDSIDERAELYRSRLAGQRVLVVLDDAADDTQLRMLLPGSPTCAVIITSRARLTGLPGSALIDLDVFEEPQARALLGKIIEPERIAGEDAAAKVLVRLVGGLPLALRIVGARLLARRHWTLAMMVTRLRDERRRLDELAHGELVVRASITLSYNGLPPEVRTLFRRLCEFDADTFPGWLAAAALDVDPHTAEDMLEQLVDAQLLDIVALDRAGGVRYRFHALIKVYGWERLREDTDDERRALCGRICGGWLALAEHAHGRLYGGQYTLLHGAAPRWSAEGASLADIVADPLEWLESERTNLCFAVRWSANAGLSELAWDLAMTLVTLFESRSYFDDWQETHDVALAAARSAGDKRGVAAMLASLGSLHLSRRRALTRQPELAEARRAFQEVGDKHGIALVERTLGMIDYGRAEAGLAEQHFRHALAGMRAAGDRVGEAYVLGSLAQLAVDAGAPDHAVGQLTEALHIARDVGSLRTEAQILHRLGGVRLDQGRLDEARDAFRTVLRLVRAHGDRAGECHAKLGLSAVGAWRGELDAAEDLLREVEMICAETADGGVTARVKFDLGQLLVRRGEPDRARDCFLAARDRFVKDGLTLWAERVDSRLAELAAGDLTGSARHRR